MKDQGNTMINPEVLQMVRLCSADINACTEQLISSRGQELGKLNWAMPQDADVKKKKKKK